MIYERNVKNHCRRRKDLEYGAYTCVFLDYVRYQNLLLNIASALVFINH